MTKTQKKSSKGGSQIQKAEDRLKAVVLADSFTKEFRPVTLQKPRVCQFFLYNK